MRLMDLVDWLQLSASYAQCYQCPITITPKTVSLAVAPKVYDASTDMTGYVSITTGVGVRHLLIMVRHLMMRVLQRLVNTLTL